MKKHIPFPSIDPVATGRNIQRLRAQNNLSVADVQQFFGFDSPQAIYLWQQGKSIPTTDHLLALSHLFCVTMNDILVTRQPQAAVTKHPPTSGSAPRWVNYIQMHHHFAA